MKKSFIFTLLLMLCATACRTSPQKNVSQLAERLHAIVDTVPGVVGIAFVSGSDTVAVNNGVSYPMMSVFKMHQALAVANALARKGAGLDSMLYVSADELDRNTWSPMLKHFGNDGDFSISVGELMRYALVSSDNNASNLMFSHILSPAGTDEFVRSVAADTTFCIRYSESEMKQNHYLSYINCTSPLSAALLIRQVFTSDIVEPSARDSIRGALTVVTTGHDRLGAAVTDAPGVLFAHKTGSGYRNAAGELIAHNDVGYFRLPDGRDYSLAVFVRDFRGSEVEASAVIAGISKAVYEHFIDYDGGGCR